MSTDTKHHNLDQVDKDDGIAYAATAPEVDHDHGTMNERSIVRRIDYRLIPPLTILYLLSFLVRLRARHSADVQDRSNLGNAVIFGLSADLGLVGTQFNTALAIFYACYVSNRRVCRLKPGRGRSALQHSAQALSGQRVPHFDHGWDCHHMHLHGLCSQFCWLDGGSGAARSRRRWFLPRHHGEFGRPHRADVQFIISQWYKRDEAALRGAILYAAASASGAFGGLLARAIQLMDGVGGYQGWRW
jgi:hypothetical protein